MSTMKPKKIMHSLERKGFTPEEGDHHYYHYYDDDGNKTVVWTKVSHGAAEIHEPLISKMAKQTKLTKPEFERLVNCTLSKESYRDLLKQKGII